MNLVSSALVTELGGWELSRVDPDVHLTCTGKHQRPIVLWSRQQIQDICEALKRRGMPVALHAHRSAPASTGLRARRVRAGPSARAQRAAGRG